MIATTLAFAISLSLIECAPQLTQVVAEPPAADQFLIVPLRIHILRTPDLALANCKLEDGDVERVVRNLNTIWRKAGIVFGVESIVHEAAVQQERFRLIVKLNEGQIGLTDFQLLLPKPSRVFDGLHAYFFHELPFNGAYVGEESVILHEGAALNAVAGGIDDTMARVLGHCFGRTFGLRPREEPPTSLLALGTTGRDLDSAEVDRARRVVKTIDGVLTVADARKAAAEFEAAQRPDYAKRLRSWLAAIPGPAGVNAKKECNETAPCRDEK
jgi:hypothetical protein